MYLPYIRTSTPRHPAVAGTPAISAIRRPCASLLVFHTHPVVHQQIRVLLEAEETHRVWDQLEVEIKKHGFHDRVLTVLSDAAFGYKVRNSLYRFAAEISENLASRDFKRLVHAGFLVATGERRGRSYGASKALLMIREKAKEPRESEHLDPFVRHQTIPQEELPFT